jgi:DNA-binding YbaB/EbfC family protein
MFKGLSNLGSLIKQAQQIGGQMQELGEELKRRRATGTAGGGMVQVEINGVLEILQCRIDEQLITQGDRELIEDLVAAAVNQAIFKGKQLHAEAMQQLTGGLQIPGLQEALAKVTNTEEPDKS